MDAPKDHLIIGLKELPEEDFPLHHTHVQFAHCFKLQKGYQSVLQRFPRGGGTLYDLEFLAEPSGKRVAAFGYHAGYAGAALALLVWSHQLQHPQTPYPSIASYPNEQTLISDVRASLEKGRALNNSKPPRVIIIGALGRCGRGGVDMCRAAGLPDSQILQWDLAETAAGGPFQEVAESDIFINTIYLTSPIPPFITKDVLAKPGRKLSVVCDVSCDPNNPHNPVPVYSEWTTFDKPTLKVDISGDENKGELSVISIDHLPSLLPREASEAFSGDLLPHLLRLDRRHEDPVWVGAEKLFREKVESLPAEER